MKNIFLIAAFLIIFIGGCKSSILDDPSTQINFIIPEPSHVKLRIENSYNTIISTLIDQDLSAGAHNINFDSSELAEGVYFYTVEIRGLKSGNYFKETKQLLLVK